MKYILLVSETPVPKLFSEVRRGKARDGLRNTCRFSWKHPWICPIL